MRFSLINHILQEAFSTVRGLAQTANPIIPSTSFLHLKHERLSTGEDSLVLKATNASVEISLRINSVDIQEPGLKEVLVPAAKMQLLSDNSAKNVEFSFNCTEKSIVVDSPGNSFHLSTLPVEQFPHMGEETTETVDFDMHPDDLRHLLEQTGYSMAPSSDARDYLKGVLLVFERDRMTSVATDGHRLSCCHVGYSTNGEGEREGTPDVSENGMDDRRIVLPAVAVREIRNVVRKAGEKVQVSVSERNVSLKLDGIRLLAKLYERSRYPDYKRVIPKEESSVYSATVSSEEFRAALARMKIVDSPLSVIELEKGLIRIKSKSEQGYEQVQIDVAAEYSGEDFRLGVNHEYLSQVFGVIDSEQTTFDFENAEKAMLIREKDGANTQHVIMPLRL